MFLDQNYMHISNIQALPSVENTIFLFFSKKNFWADIATFSRAPVAM